MPALEPEVDAARLGLLRLLDDDLARDRREVDRHPAPIRGVVLPREVEQLPDEPHGALHARLEPLERLLALRARGHALERPGAAAPPP